MEKNLIIKYVIDIGLAVAFLLNVITGILKFPALTSYFKFVFRSISSYNLALIHDWSGIALVVLVLVHLILNFRWIVGMTKFIFKRR
jgi:cytochrome b subunit of formate dehydrogenase